MNRENSRFTPPAYCWFELERAGKLEGVRPEIRESVSGDGSRSFTERQLWYEFNRRMLRKTFWRAPWGWVAGVCAPTGIILTAVSGGFGFLAISAAGVGVVVQRERQ